MAPIPDPIVMPGEASPNCELLRTVVGIESIAPGFERVSISPNLEKLENVTASMPHPKGELKVDLRRDGEKGLIADVRLPPGISGEVVFGGVYCSLIAGPNHVKLEFK
jgi:alpha-L-rhamnosidase